MKETLFDIISSHREWYTTDADCVGMKQAAVQYANELASLGNHWRTAFEGQIQAMFSALIPIGIDLKRYRYAVADFLANVRAALAENCGLGEELKQLSPSTQWIVGIEDSKWSIKEHLSKDEAALQVENLKQQGHMVYCFRELCSDLYTTIGVHAGHERSNKPSRANDKPKRAKLGRKKIPFRDCFSNKNTDVLIEDLKSKLSGNPSRINIVDYFRNFWQNKFIIRKIPYNAFEETFPHLRIPRSSYDELWRKLLDDFGVK